MSNEQSKAVVNETTKVVTKVIDVRHKAPDQAIHELMQAAKDGFAVTKIATRFNHTHVYLEASSKQVGEASSKQSSKTDDTAKETSVEKEEVKSEPTKVEPVKTTAKKTTSKTTATKKVETEAKDSE